MGNYNLTITFFSTAGQPGSIQDDGRKGVDAGGSISSALDISGPTTNFTTTVWVDSTCDINDYYAIDVPENKTIWSTLEWSGSYIYFYLYSPSGTTIDSDYYYNPASVTANSTLVSGSTVFFRVYAASSSSVDINYTLTFNFSDISILLGS